jgi:hypothetical protein
MRSDGIRRSSYYFHQMPVKNRFILAWKTSVNVPAPGHERDAVALDDPTARQPSCLGSNRSSSFSKALGRSVRPARAKTDFQTGSEDQFNACRH